MSEGSRRRGLGRGLDALLRPEQGVREIEIGRLRPPRTTASRDSSLR